MAKQVLLDDDRRWGRLDADTLFIFIVNNVLLPWLYLRRGSN